MPRTPTTDPAVISYLFPEKVAPHPLGPFDPRPCFSPALLIANTDRPTAEQLGWVRESNAGARQRYNTLRKITSVQKEVEVLRRIRQGQRRVDIAMELGISVHTVSAAVKRSLKRATTYAGAEKERDHQLEITERVMQRLMQAIDPGPGEDGYEPHVDTKAVAELMKVLNRRASLTGADQPTKVHMQGQVAHTISAADATVEKVHEYMDLVDRVMDMGYGSGRKREELEPAEKDRILDAEVIEPVAEEVVAHSAPIPLHSLPDGDDPEC